MVIAVKNMFRSLNPFEIVYLDPYALPQPTTRSNDMKNTKIG